jgi:hypothetical protein
MSKLLERCKACVDSDFRDWEKTRLSTEEKRTIEEYVAWGMVRIALYILDFDEYNAFKQYIYDQHGYDPGGVTTGQADLEEVEVSMEEGGM